MDELHLPPSCTTFGDIVRWRARQQPERVAHIYLADGDIQEIRLTYAQLDRRARAIAARLQQLSTPGERALLIYPSGIDYIAALFGCLYAGVVAVPVSLPDMSQPQQAQASLQAIVRDAQPAAALSIAACQPMLNLLMPQGPQPLLTDRLDNQLAQQWRQEDIDGDSSALIFYTSGSTSAPKGVVVSHRDILHTAAVNHAMFEHSERSVLVNWMPMYVGSIFSIFIAQAVYSNTLSVFLPTESVLEEPMRWLRALSRYHGTMSLGPNLIYELCVQRVQPQDLRDLDLRCWESTCTGTEPIRPHLLEQFAHTFAPCGFRQEAIRAGYGATEAFNTVTMAEKGKPPTIFHVSAQALAEHRITPISADDSQAVALISCGRTWHDMSLRIVDPISRLLCASDEVGEIWIPGELVARGYWQKPEATAETFQAYLATGAGPFLRTGDLGFLRDGELFVAGRIKEMIIVRGKNHYPQDIESTMEQCHPPKLPTMMK